MVPTQNGVPFWYFQKHGGELDGRIVESVDPGGVCVANIEKERIVGCVVYPAAEIAAPGVIHVIEGDRFPIGELDGAESERAQRISDAFIRAGYKSPILPNIRAEMWLKLWGNLTFNPISALSHSTLVDICQFPLSRDLAAKMMTEAQTIANKLGIQFRVTLEKRIAGAEKVGKHKTSMLQDVEVGRVLEVDALVGAVVELGRMTGMPTPHIDAVYALTKLLDKTMQEEKVLHPGPATHLMVDFDGRDRRRRAGRREPRREPARQRLCGLPSSSLPHRARWARPGTAASTPSARGRSRFWKPAAPGSGWTRPASRRCSTCTSGGMTGRPDSTSAASRPGARRLPRSSRAPGCRPPSGRRLRPTTRSRCGVRRRAHRSPGSTIGRRSPCRTASACAPGSWWARTERSPGSASRRGIAAATHAYGQLGVVANFACARPHGGVARQWFRRDGVLALLPMPGNRVSMVWSTWEAPGRTLVALAGEALCAQVQEASHDAVGELSLITPAAAFPLRRTKVERLIAPRVALIGDAAHVVHPLAGQGVNLGFRDARELAAVLRDRAPASDCGAVPLLRRFERARSEDILSMMLTTDALQKLFNTDLPALAAVRNWGLRLTGRLGPVRTLLTQHAVG